MAEFIDNIDRRLTHTRRVSLFLDYDGTLVSFAPTPQNAEPDPTVVELIRRLKTQARLRVAIVSGRPLTQLQTLIPVPGVVLAGTYGIEIRLASGEIISRADFAAARPLLERLKPEWERLVADRKGYFLEDKGWALAIHARFADVREAQAVLEQAQILASSDPSFIDLFKIFRDGQFVEICSGTINKGDTVRFLLGHDPWEGAVPIYIGDDARDEDAFAIINVSKGISVRVGAVINETKAKYVVESPLKVRRWLESLASAD